MHRLLLATLLLSPFDACEEEPQEHAYYVILPDGLSLPENTQMYVDDDYVRNAGGLSSSFSRPRSAPLSKSKLSLRYDTPCGVLQSPLKFDAEALARQEQTTEHFMTIEVAVEEATPAGWKVDDDVKLWVDFRGKTKLEVGETVVSAPQKKNYSKVAGTSCAKSFALELDGESAGSLEPASGDYFFVGQPGKCYTLTEHRYSNDAFGGTPAPPKKLPGGQVHTLANPIFFFLEPATESLSVTVDPELPSFSDAATVYALNETPCGA